MTEQDGIPAALGATLFLGVLAYYAYGQLRMGRFGSWWGNPWESETYHVGAARVSGLFGLTFCTVGLVAVWWTTIAQLH